MTSPLTFDPCVPVELIHLACTLYVGVLCPTPKVTVSWGGDQEVPANTPPPTCGQRMEAVFRGMCHLL